MSERPKIADDLLGEVAERFAVLGQVARLRLIELLAGGQATPQELADELGLSQQNVSKHLRILQRAGLVDRRQAGSNAFYSLHDERMLAIVDAVHASVLAHLEELSSRARGARDAGNTPRPE